MAWVGGPERPMNVPLEKEPLTIFDEEVVTFFPEMPSNEALRDAVNSSGYGRVVETKEQIERRRKELAERVVTEENHELTFRPNIIAPTGDAPSKARLQIMSQVRSSGYTKPTSAESGPAWLREASQRLKEKKKPVTARPRPKTAPDGAPMFRPQLGTGRAARIRSEAPSSGYGRKPAKKPDPPPKGERPPFKPQVKRQTKTSKEVKLKARSSKYGRKPTQVHVGFEEDSDGKVKKVLSPRVEKYAGRATAESKLTARRSRPTLVSQSETHAPEETDPETATREKGFVLDGVRVANTCPLRAKYIEDTSDPIGNIDTLPKPESLHGTKFDSNTRKLRRQYTAQAASSGYGRRFEPMVGRIDEPGDAVRVWSAEAKRWVMEPKDKDGWEWVPRDGDVEGHWRRKELPHDLAAQLEDRPKFNAHAALAKPKPLDVDSWLGGAGAEGVANMFPLSKPMPEPPRTVHNVPSSEYGRKVPGWEYDPDSGAHVAVKVVADDHGVRRVRAEKKLPPSDSDPTIQALHGGASFRAGTGKKGFDKFVEPADKEVAWREAPKRHALKNAVGSHGYGVVFPEVRPRPEHDEAPVWVPNSKKPEIPEPDPPTLTPLARAAVGHYGPGYDPAAGIYHDDMYEEYEEEEESEGEGEGEETESEGEEA